MKMIAKLILCTALLPLFAGAGPAYGQTYSQTYVQTYAQADGPNPELRPFARQLNNTEQGKARKEMRAGNQLSLREIEKRVLPKMKGSEYLGPSYDSAARAYRLKFIKEGRVIYVDVNARTGKIIRRSR